MAPLRIHVVTIFSEMLQGPLASGIVGRAQEAGLAEVHLHDIRDHAHDRHRTVDDAPFGGDPGMVMRPEPLFAAVGALELAPSTPIVLLTPQGRTFRQADAERLSQLPELVMLCGRYEGVDERVREHLATEELSIGDFVMSGGEIPAMAVIDAVVRLLPGALGHGSDALKDDTFTSGLLQHPQYTRPAAYRGWTVPEVLRSGDHAKIAQWRRREALRRTLERRPDLLTRARLTEDDLKELRGRGWTDEPG